MIIQVLSSFLLVTLNSAYANVTVTGKIVFEDGPPEKLDANTWMTVKIEDVSLQDAPSVNLGKRFSQIVDYNKERPITFEINDVKSSDGKDITIAAVINVGWKPEGDEWIREGDYHTDTHTSIDLSANEQSIVKDVAVKKYE